jgi:integrase
MLDIATLIELAEEIDERYRALVLLAGLGGLRNGEMLGLERRDIDFLRHTTLSWTFSRHNIGHTEFESQDCKETRRWAR